MRTIVFFIFIIIGFNVYAQIRISGYISDKDTGERLIGANIYEINSKTGAVSNQFGYYSFLLHNTNFCELRVSFIGYQTVNVKFNLKRDTVINFSLNSNISLQEVVVTAERSIEKRSEMSVVEIPIQQLKTLPMLAGEVDIIKAMQLMPGIKSGSEGQSGMYVRGGSHDQNLILLDDVPIYYINHLGGFVSVFNPDAINNLKLYKGGFPARYGGRLSSVMDVRMKDGNLNKRKTNITFGLISSKFQTEAPIKKDTSSYIISGRRFMYDLFSRPITWLVNDKHSMGYTFYDLNIKLNYKFSEKNRLFFSFYMGNDKILTRKKDREDGEKELMENKGKWGNLLFALRWNHIFNNHFFGNITTYYTKYNYLSAFKFKNEKIDKISEVHYNFSSGINDYCVKSDFEYYTSNLTIRFGSKHVYHIFKPNTGFIKQRGFSNIDSSFNVKKYYAFENSLYIENEMKIGKNINFNIGAKANFYSIENKHYSNIEPRFLTNLNIPKYFALKASYCKMIQYVHLLSYSGAGLPADLWMPTTQNVPPQHSDLFAAGISKSLFNNAIELSIETYYKTMNNLIDYSAGESFAGNNTKNWEQLIEIDGNGKSKGIELLIQKKQGKFNGWIAYTLSKTTRQFDNLNLGREFLYTYDATHDFAITGNYYFKENLYFSLTWVYTSGRAVTMPNEHYTSIRLLHNQNITENIIPDYERISYTSYYEKNNVRMHPYHRLDLGLTYKKNKRKSERIWSFSIYNAYNRQNPYYYYTTIDKVEDVNGNETNEYKKNTYARSLFPVIPAISYTIKY